MQLNWKDYLALHAPHILLFLCMFVGGIYTFGYENGKRSILLAAQNAVNEVK